MCNELTGETRTSSDLLTALTGDYSLAVLSQLRDAPADVTSLDALVAQIGAHEPEREKRIAIKLHHSTLPRLDGAGVLEYDTRSHTIRYHGHPELERMADCIE